MKLSRHKSRKAQLMDSLMREWANGIDALRRTRESRGISLPEMARQLEVSEDLLRRVEGLEVAPSLELLAFYAYELDQDMHLRFDQFDPQAGSVSETPIGRTRTTFTPNATRRWHEATI